MKILKLLLKGIVKSIQCNLDPSGHRDRAAGPITIS